MAGVLKGVYILWCEVYKCLLKPEQEILNVVLAHEKLIGEDRTRFAASRRASHRGAAVRSV
jgi:hypothetical protein